MFQIAVHVYNRTPNKHLAWKTPIEAFKTKKLDVSYFQTPGCSAYVYLDKELHAHKLAPKTEKMILVRYVPGSKAWLFIRNTERTFISSTAIFDESDFPKCKTTSIKSALIKHANNIPLPSSLSHDTDHFISDQDTNHQPNQEVITDTDHPAAPDPSHEDLDDHELANNIPIPAPASHQQLELRCSQRPTQVPNC
uniref:Retroviral polymerase SH3-like domain-containing protein n=1 Tax=Moniliophthora roreri TaxID=221103 RepID=A0A0W0FP61_MONRR